MILRGIFVFVSLTVTIHPRVDEGHAVSNRSPHTPQIEWVSNPGTNFGIWNTDTVNIKLMKGYNDWPKSSHTNNRIEYLTRQFSPLT